MKYVKVLKNNEYSIFEVIEEYEKTIQCKLANCENGYIIISKNNVVKEADTIEELCDGFYLDLGEEFDDTYLRRKDRFEFLKELALEYMRRDIEVTLYGFIKTDKGLIYVAKLNEDGKLVLI